MQAKLTLTQSRSLKPEEGITKIDCVVGAGELGSGESPLACKGESVKCTQVHVHADGPEWRKVALKAPCEQREEQISQHHQILWVGMYPQRS